MRLGVILPPAGPLNGMGGVVRQVLSAYADQISRRGGIYGRRVEMVFLVPPPAPDARLEAIWSFLRRDDIFALTASFLSGVDQAVASLVQELEVPLPGGIQPPSVRNSDLPSLHIRDRPGTWRAGACVATIRGR